MKYFQDGIAYTMMAQWFQRGMSKMMSGSYHSFVSMSNWMLLLYCDSPFQPPKK